MDYHHHYADVVAGSLLGTGVALVVYAARGAVVAKLMQKEEDGEMRGNGSRLYEAAEGEVQV